MKKALFSLIFSLMALVGGVSVCAETLHEQYGIQILNADFATPGTTFATSYTNPDYMTGAHFAVQNADYANIGNYGGGYITMGVNGAARQTALTLSFGASGEGMEAKAGRYTASYMVAAAKGSTSSTFTGYIDRVTMDGVPTDLDNGTAYADILRVADSWYTNTVAWNVSAATETLNSYQMLMTSSGKQYYDSFSLWHYPENAFMLSQNGELSLVTPTADTYTFPGKEGQVWQHELEEYKAGEAVDVKKLAYKTFTLATKDILHEEYGIRLVFADFKSKTWDVTDFNSAYMKNATVAASQADKECYVSASGDGYLVLSRHSLNHTRVYLSFNDGAGIPAKKGKYTTEYDVALNRGATDADVGEFRDRIFINGSTASTDTFTDFVHSGVCKALVEKADAWVHETVHWTPPAKATVINSYNMYLQSAIRQYYDNIAIWYFPEKSFMLKVGEKLTLITLSEDTYTLPEIEGYAGFVIGSRLYRSGTSVALTELEYQTAKAVKDISDLDPALISINYDFANTRAGSADGTVSIDFGAQDGRYCDIALYWGNESGPLPDFTPLRVTSGIEMLTGYTFSKALAFPKEATTLIARITDTLKTFDVVYSIPLTKRAPAKEPLYTVAFASDIHIGYGGIALRSTQLKACEEINRFADFLVVVGDFTQWYGQITEDKIGEWALAEEYFKGYTIPVYFAKGNHDEPNHNDSYVASVGYDKFSYEHFDRFLDMWLAYSKEKGDYDVKRIDSTTDYYDCFIGGHHYIFLAIPNEGYYKFGEAQLKWLDEKLYKYEASGEPIFLLGHIPVGTRVSHPSTVWNEFQSPELDAILERHPNAIYISGDTHYTLDTDWNNTVNGEQLHPSFATDGAVIDAWIAVDEADPDNPTWQAIPGDNAMGLIAEVYNDRILLKGRHFVNGQWIARGFSEITFAEKCPLKEISVSKRLTADGKLELMVDKPDADFTYTWYTDNATILGSGTSLTLESDFASFVAIRAINNQGSYRSDSFSSLSDIPVRSSDEPIQMLSSSTLRLNTPGAINGIRFEAGVSPALKARAHEYGFLVSRTELLNESALTFALDDGLYVSGVAYQKDVLGNVVKDIVKSTDADGNESIACVCVGLSFESPTHREASLIARPYYKMKVDGVETVFYGSTFTTSLQKTAAAERDSSSDTYKANKEVIDTLAQAQNK